MLDRIDVKKPNLQSFRNAVIAGKSVGKNSSEVKVLDQKDDRQ